ncbi:lipoprotein [Roseibium aggregatum]|uniref:Type IV secretion system putative lipoprotein virB7 n=1 Tax=Roseibium aggregatum TaxID=187304 RepID=A0A0M6Y6I4_9HYPH|nr:lipoprotein [Roseibium aggregatum]CTQ45716.1 hypothetical protein LAL4801_04171 [Roseibium aggregatum]
MKRMISLALLALSLAGCQQVSTVGTLGENGLTLSMVRLPTLKDANAKAAAYCAQYGKVAEAQNPYWQTIDGLVTYACVEG